MPQHDNPEVAFAIVVPWAYQGHSGHTMTKDIGCSSTG